MQPFNYMAWHTSINNTRRANWFSVIWRSIFCRCSAHFIRNGSVWLVMVPFTVIELYLQNWGGTKTSNNILYMNHTSFLSHTHRVLNTVSLVWHGSLSTGWWVLIAVESRVWFSSGVAVWMKAAAGHSVATLTPRGAGTQPLTSLLSQLQSSSACLKRHNTPTACLCVCVCVLNLSNAQPCLTAVDTNSILIWAD